MIDTLYTIYTSYDKLLQYDIKHDTSKLLYCTAISRIDSCAEKITQYDITDQDLTNLYRIRKILWNRLCANGWELSSADTQTYTITAVQGDNYTITPSGNRTVYKGSNLTYTVLPNTGYTISSIVVDGQPTTETAEHQYTFTNIQANHTIGAVATQVMPTSVSITGVSSIEVGNAAQFYATVLPSTSYDKTITWSSSNISVATISSSGLLTALAIGTVTITATTVNNVQKTYQVSIVAAKVHYVITSSNATGVTVSPLGAQDVIEGNDITFTFSASSGYTLQYAVVDGVQTPNFDNTSSDTYTFTDIQSDHTITATAQAIVPTSITISGLNSVYIDNMITLTATISPTNALNKTVTWISSDSAIATISSTGIVTGVSAGTATITATSSNGLTATKDITVSQEIVNYIYYGYITYAEWIAHTSGTTYAAVTEQMCTDAVNMDSSAVRTFEMQPITTTSNSDMMCIAIPASSSYVCKKYSGIGSGDASYIQWSTAQIGANGTVVDFNGVSYKIYGQYANVAGTTYFQIK